MLEGGKETDPEKKAEKFDNVANEIAIKLATDENGNVDAGKAAEARAQLEERERAYQDKLVIQEKQAVAAKEEGKEPMSKEQIAREAENRNKPKSPNEVSFVDKVNAQKQEKQQAPSTPTAPPLPGKGI
jgi:sRNA-binding protein